MTDFSTSSGLMCMTWASEWSSQTTAWKWDMVALSWMMGAKLRRIATRLD
jgi:hypothetical protein